MHYSARAETCVIWIAAPLINNLRAARIYHYHVVETTHVRFDGWRFDGLLLVPGFTNNAHVDGIRGFKS